MMKRKVIGYVVSEEDPDGSHKQFLRIDESTGSPKGGIVDFGGHPYLFKTRRDARAAIVRTEHYRMAFGLKFLPEAKNCKVHAVEGAAS